MSFNGHCLIVLGDDCTAVGSHIWQLDLCNPAQKQTLSSDLLLCSVWAEQWNETNPMLQGFLPQVRGKQRCSFIPVDPKTFYNVSNIDIFHVTLELKDHEANKLKRRCVSAMITMINTELNHQTLCRLEMDYGLYYKCPFHSVYLSVLMTSHRSSSKGIWTWLVSENSSSCPSLSHTTSGGPSSPSSPSSIFSTHCISTGFPSDDVMFPGLCWKRNPEKETWRTGQLYPTPLYNTSLGWLLIFAFFWGVF